MDGRIVIKSGELFGLELTYSRLHHVDADAGLRPMKDRSEKYRGFAAECLRLAATTDDANSHAQYTALAQMWNELADEAAARRAIFRQAQETFNEGQIVHQQEQVQPEKPEEGKS